MISRMIYILTRIKSCQLKGQRSCDIIASSASLEADEACSSLFTLVASSCSPEVRSVPFHVFVPSTWHSDQHI